MTSVKRPINIAAPLPFARIDVGGALETAEEQSAVPFVVYDAIEDEVECASLKALDNTKFWSEFDGEETAFMQTLTSMDAVSLAVYANVTRWVCGLLGCSVETGYQSDLDADVHIIRGYHSDIIIVCVEPSRLLMSKSGYGTLSEQYFQRVATYAVSQTIATSFVITNYADWTFATLAVCDDNIHLQCVALHSSSVGPSIRERIISEACYFNPDQKQLWLCLEQKRRHMREVERSRGSVNSRFPRIHGLAHLSVGGSRRRCETSRLAKAGKVDGVLDLLHDNIWLHTVARATERCRKVRHDGVDMYEKLVRSEEELKHLLDIYKILCTLQGTTIPYLYSIIVADPYQRGTHRRELGVLVSDMGSMRLEDWLKHPIAGKAKSQQLGSQNAIIEHVAKSAFLALESVHALKVAHQNVAGHIVIDPEDLTVSIVGLSTAVANASEHLFKKDVIALRKVFLAQ